jgi:methane/ammonia monooxygenase subunit B
VVKSDETKIRGGEQSMDRRLVISLVAVTITAIASIPKAFAHGEAADKPFLKNLTVAFLDVSIAPTEIEVGQPVTIAGRVKILETWPHTLYPPEIASVVPVVPGPVFALQDRTINGQPAPGSFFVEKGGIYQFQMVILGREPGRWHVHPGMAVHGTGTLIGPGEWVTVQPSAAPFAFEVPLLSGQTINLESYGGPFAWWWSFAGFLLGVAWMLYWTLTKRTVTNLAVTTQLPVNDDAPDIGLITPRDHMWMNVLAGLTLVMLVIGWTYMTMAHPVRLPQQTAWITPSPISSGEKMAEVQPKRATYDQATDMLVMDVQVKNVMGSAITLKQFIMAMTTFVNGGEAEQAKAGPRDFVGLLEVDPNSPIAPGETKDLTLRISSPLFSEERLIPLEDPQQFIAGLLRFENAQGDQELVTIRTSVIPAQFRSQILP